MFPGCKAAAEQALFEHHTAEAAINAILEKGIEHFTLKAKPAQAKPFGGNTIGIDSGTSNSSSTSMDIVSPYPGVRGSILVKNVAPPQDVNPLTGASSSSAAAVPPKRFNKNSFENDAAAASSSSAAASSSAPTQNVAASSSAALPQDEKIAQFLKREKDNIATIKVSSDGLRKFKDADVSGGASSPKAKQRPKVEDKFHKDCQLFCSCGSNFFQNLNVFTKIIKIFFFRNSKISN